MLSNRQQPRDESPTGDKSDRVEKTNMVESLIEVYRDFFPVRKNPMSALCRFFFAWLGSLIVFSGAYSDKTRWAANKLLEHSDKLSKYDNEVIVVIEILKVLSDKFANATYQLGILPFVFALIIASSKTKHGPLGLFVLGLVLAASVVTLIQKIYAG